MVLLLLVFLFYTRNTTQVGSKVVKKVVFIPAGGSWYYQKKNNFMAPFYRWGSTVSGLSHFEVAVYFLPLSSQKFLVLVLLTSEGWKAELILEPLSCFEQGIQQLNHYTILIKKIRKHHKGNNIYQLGDGNCFAAIENIGMSIVLGKQHENP